MQTKIKTAPIGEILDGPFETLFRTALAPSEDKDKKGITIARLIFNLAQARADNGQLVDSTAPTRAVVVLGLRSYNEAAQAQGKRLHDMAVALRNDMYLGPNSERAQFIARHQEVLEQLKKLAVAVGGEQYTLAQLQEEQAKLEQQVRARQLVVKEYQDKLAKAEAETQANLKEQAKLLEQLFQAWLDLARTADENVTKLEDIRRRELPAEGRRP
jgi:hypothetical protein